MIALLRCGTPTQLWRVLLGEPRERARQGRSQARPTQASGADECSEWSECLSPADSASSVGITVYKLARIMGTSVSMIEAHYGALLDTAHTRLLDHLESLGVLEWHEPEAEDA